jgi:D-cysteine desulfhydrase
VRQSPLLFDAFPGLAERVPWVPLAELPTPVESCEAIRDWLGRGGVYMKRDDLVSPLYSGNKVRRYEFVLADARDKGAERIVTVGGIASTQVMATALFGREQGFSVRVVLFDQPVTSFALQSILGYVSAGAEVIYGGNYLMTALRAWRAYRRGKHNYLIMPGAANPLANLGYIDAMLELAQQVEKNELPRPDVIVVPSGSSGTLAALSLGAAYLGWSTEIIGVRITTSLACNRFMANSIIRSTDRFLAEREPRWKRMSSRVNFSIYGKELGPGYGHPTPHAEEGAKQVERLTGAPGEITYSGKGLAGLRAIGASPEYKDKTLLLWNTLSTPRPILADDARSRVPPTLEWVFQRALVA